MNIVAPSEAHPTPLKLRRITAPSRKNTILITARRRVTRVTCGILAILGVFLGPTAIMAQTTQVAGESPKNAVTGPINDLTKPFQDFKDTLLNKIPQIDGTTGVNNAKSYLEQHGISFNSIGTTLNGLVGWFQDRMNSLSSAPFIGWAIDFIKRIILMIFEFATKLLSYL